MRVFGLMYRSRIAKAEKGKTFWFNLVVETSKGVTLGHKSNTICKVPVVLYLTSMKKYISLI